MAKKKPTISVRKPPPPADAARAAFIAGGATSRPRAGKTTTYTRKTGDSQGQELRRTTLYLPALLFKKARIAALEADLPLSEYVTRLLESTLSKQ